MRIRLVIDLQYPMASSQEHEELIKHRLSAQVIAAARSKQFNVLTVDEETEITVGEVMVGCARVAEDDKYPQAVAAAAAGVPEKDATLLPDPHVYGDEDGDYWFASGHLSVDDMVTAVIDWECEVADPIDATDVDWATHSIYHVIEDPDNSERYLIVSHDHPNAQPMTSIRRM